MKAELTHGNTPQDGHTVLATNLANDRCYAFSAYVMNAVPGKVAIACTHPDGIVIPPADAMMCAEAIVNAVADADPEGFDALWMGLVASVRAARTPKPSTGWTDAEIAAHEAQYPEGPNVTNGDDESMEVLTGTTLAR